MLVNKNWKRQIGRVVAGILLVLMLVPQTAFAIDPLEVGADVTLTVNYEGTDGTLISGAEFYLYKVGEIDRFGEVEPTGAFADYPLSYKELDASGWKKLAGMLAVYVEKDEIEPMDSGMTDAQGTLNFPNNVEEMTTGLYLVMGEEYIYQHQRYTPEAALICLPNRDENEDWIYDVVMNPKYGPVVEMTQIQVIKKWDDDENSAGERPEEIQIQLLNDGKEVETITLSKENNWRYTWTDLEPSSEWTVVEKDVPEGYTVDLEQDGNIFVFTNIYEEPTDDFEDEGDNTPDSSGGNRPGGNKPSGRLPQTGMLWWPVPVLAAAGMMFFTIGWVKRQKSEN